MKPNPFFTSNHFTTPLGMTTSFAGYGRLTHARSLDRGTERFRADWPVLYEEAPADAPLTHGMPPFFCDRRRHSRPGNGTTTRSSQTPFPRTGKGVLRSSIRPCGGCLLQDGDLARQLDAALVVDGEDLHPHR